MFAKIRMALLAASWACCIGLATAAYGVSLRADVNDAHGLPPNAIVENPRDPFVRVMEHAPNGDYFRIGPGHGMMGCG